MGIPQCSERSHSSAHSGSDAWTVRDTAQKLRSHGDEANPHEHTIPWSCSSHGRTRTTASTVLCRLLFYVHTVYVYIHDTVQQLQYYKLRIFGLVVLFVFQQ